ARSSSSDGVNSTCAGPPTRNQVSGARLALARSRPRNCGIAALRSGVISENAATLSQCLQFAGQRIGPLRDAAGAETDDQVAAGRESLDDPGEIGGFWQRHHLAMAMCAQAQDKMIAVD